jgi:hypothetical protein
MFFSIKARIRPLCRPGKGLSKKELPALVGKAPELFFTKNLPSQASAG